MDRYRQMRGGDALIVRKTRAYETSGNYQVLEREVTDSSPAAHYGQSRSIATDWDFRSSPNMTRLPARAVLFSVL